MTAIGQSASSSGFPANLPVTVGAELKLNSVIPPPDTIEEVTKHHLRVMTSRKA
jgi:hypothetical protein